MSTLTHDTPRGVPRASVPPRTLGPGLVLALVSATSFGMSGALARGLLDTGWSAGALVVARIGIAALVVLPFALVALRGRWFLLRRNAGLITLYGVLAVAGAQFCYFSAVQYMQVGPAILIEYTAPAAVVVWMWFRHGQRRADDARRRRPRPWAGACWTRSPAKDREPGVLWSLGAMIGLREPLPHQPRRHHRPAADRPGGGGLVVGTLAIALLGLVGIMPMHARRPTMTYAGSSFAWWQPIVVLGIVTAALSYVTGVAAARLPGSRRPPRRADRGPRQRALGLAPAGRAAGLTQIVGGLLIVAGVVCVKLGESRSTSRSTSRYVLVLSATTARPRVCCAWMWAWTQVSRARPAPARRRSTPGRPPGCAGLLRFAYLVVGSQHAAEDAVQEALTSACAKWAAVSAPGPGRVRAADDRQRARLGLAAHAA